MLTMPALARYPRRAAARLPRWESLLGALCQFMDPASEFQGQPKPLALLPTGPLASMPLIAAGNSANRGILAPWQPQTRRHTPSRQPSR